MNTTVRRRALIRAGGGASRTPGPGWLGPRSGRRSGAGYRNLGRTLFPRETSDQRAGEFMSISSTRHPTAAIAPRPVRTAAIRLYPVETFIVLAALVGLAAVYATDQVVPATSAHQADMRIWLAARASGFLTLGLLTVQVVLGLILSHPTNKTTWKSRSSSSRGTRTPGSSSWRSWLLHVVTLVADPYAGVGIGGAIVPGLSSYRSAPWRWARSRSTRSSSPA